MGTESKYLAREHPTGSSYKKKREKRNKVNGVGHLGHLRPPCVHIIGLTRLAGKPPRDGEMNEMTLPLQA